MGGNIFINAGRLDAAQYHQLVQRLVTDFKRKQPKLSIEAITAYSEKESFGDLDFLVTGISKEELEMYVAGQTDYFGVSHNGPVVSYAYKLSDFEIEASHEAFQVDFIFVEPEEFEFAKNYFAYNDLGNLIGQTAAGLGLKFGHKGLYYKYIEDTQLLGEILITRNFYEALEFLGYDYIRYLNQEFKTLEDVFTFAASSKYFSTWNYQLENRNHVGRIRDKKRSTYTKFLEWMKDKVLPDNPPDKEKGIILSSKLYPHIAIEFVQLTLDRQLADRAKQLFNGQNVALRTGLQGKELGQVMQLIKNQYPTQKEFHKAIVNMSPEKIGEMIDAVVAKYKAEV
ncbi:hypothetical protein D3C87_279360 [compost metagenome]